MSTQATAVSTSSSHEVDSQQLDDTTFAIEVEMQQKPEWTCAQLALVIHDLRDRGLIHQVPRELRPANLPFLDAMLNPHIEPSKCHSKADAMCIARQVCIDAGQCNKHS